jgi:hypothetical protein
MACLGYCNDPRAKALHSKVDAIAHPDLEQRVMKEFDGKIAELRKADPKLTRTAAMERVRRTDPQLERALSAAMHGR